MADIKIVTFAKHRFGKMIRVKGVEIHVGSDGVALVPEDKVAYALCAGFELVDKKQKFTSKEELEKVEDVNALIEKAKAEAAEIIESAKKEAEKIIAEARKEAEGVKEEAHVDAKEEKRKELAGKKKEELATLLMETGVEAAEIEGKKKEDLVEMLIDIIFAE